MEKFRLEENGYNRQDVNDFVSKVVQQTKELIVKIDRQQEEINYYKQLENAVKDAIIRAEKTGNEIINTALEERKKIIEDAKQNASNIINETLLQSEKIELQSEMLKKNIKVIKDRLASILKQQMSIVEEIDDIEVKDE